MVRSNKQPLLSSQGVSKISDSERAKRVTNEDLINCFACQLGIQDHIKYSFGTQTLNNGWRKIKKKYSWIQ